MKNDVLEAKLGMEQGKSGLWAARDRDGSLRLHRFPPVRKAMRGVWASPVSMPVEEKWFPELKWEDWPAEVFLITPIKK